jgi:hypothetical protein
MLTTLTSSHRLTLLILGLVVASLVTSMLVSGALALLVAVVLCVVIWILRATLMPAGYGAMKVRTLTIIGAFGIAASHNFWAEIVNQAARAALSYPYVREHAAWLAGLHLESEASNAVLLLVGFCVWVVFHYLTDKSIAGGHPAPLSQDFPELLFSEELQIFCHALGKHLVGIDRQSQWSPRYYTELEAEVEVTTTSGREGGRRIDNLQAALRSDHDTRSFLVLGEPGAGKSVALRKLAMDMLAEAPKTGRVPLYINLREWLPADGRQHGWTELAPPTVAQLEAFVIDNLRSRGDQQTEDFVDKYFRKLAGHGRLVLIFDSFDEIPELLDVAEESWLIETLSSVLTRFICSHPEGRGVVASREFRRPTSDYQAQKTLSIRPMSDARIIRALGRRAGFSPALRSALFAERNDLVPVARNPFLMDLLSEWIENFGTLPANQSEMYSHCLRKRLGKREDRLKKHNLDIDAVLAGATDIAWFVFHSPAYGLEAPVELIGYEAQIPNAAAIIDILRRARIARVSEGDTPSFAFVHRRFLEYLVTTRLLRHPELAPVEHIPTDSRGRDAMVLYAQLCDLPTAESLAARCWAEVRDNFSHPAQRSRAVHCLRFLTDAYCARRVAVAGFADQLATFIAQHMAPDDNMVYANICVEATGLLSEEQAVPTLQRALEGKNYWLQQTAFRACRALPRLKPALQRAMADYLLTMPLQQFWRHREGLLLSLSLSEATAGPYRVARIRLYNLVASLGAAVPAICAMPLVAMMMAGWLLAVQFISMILFRDAAAPRKQPVRSPQMAAAVAIATSDPLWQPMRILLALGLAGFGLLLALLACIAAQKPSGHFSLLLPILSFELPVMGLSLLTLTAMLMDWYCAAAIWRVLLKLRIDRTAILIVLASCAIVALLFTCINWLLNSELRWVPPVMIGLFVAWVFLFSGYQAVLYVRFCYRDYQVYRSLKIGSRMARTDIATVLDSLRWERLRLAMVRKLAQQRTSAHGEWPPGFNLPVSGGPALTELAMLERRWLKLDR